MKDMSCLPVTPEMLRAQRSKFESLLEKAEWKPHRNADAILKGSAPAKTGGFARSGSLEAQRQAASLLGGIKMVCQDPLMVDTIPSGIVSALRTGLSLGLYVFEQYAKAVGLEHLISLNNTRKLPVTQEGEYHAKLRTSSAIVLYAAFSYVKWELASLENDKVGSIEVDFKGVPEMDLINPMASITCQLFYLGWYVEKSGAVHSPLQLIKLIQKYADALLVDLRHQKDSFEHLEAFTQNSYKLEGTEFALSGFEETSSRIVMGSSEFKRISFDDIVGNHVAKHAAKRRAERLACYDPVEKNNPWLVLGGLASILMGYGKAGTGKSLLIASTATLCDERCQRRGIPFIFNPLPDTIVSTFQGGSGERMENWFKSMRQTGAVIYSPIDDGENNLENRTRQGVSAGVREIIGVFLRQTEGASAINHGNTGIDIMTNLPEQIDPAVLSRIQGRFPIDGAVTAVDFADQDYLWWKKLKDLSPEFIDIAPWPNHVYMSTQSELGSLGEIETGEFEINDERVARIVHDVSKRHDIKDDRFYAVFYEEVQKVHAGFTSRDVRNIQTAINLRITDFDTPDEWFDDPSLFFAHPFAHRVNMLRDLMKNNMRGLSFSDLRYRESVNYVVNSIGIAEKEFDRNVEGRISAHKVEAEALRRMEIRD